jgi:hypothetical protein
VRTADVVPVSGASAIDGGLDLLAEAVLDGFVGDVIDHVGFDEGTAGGAHHGGDGVFERGPGVEVRSVAGGELVVFVFFAGTDEVAGGEGAGPGCAASSPGFRIAPRLRG